MSQKQAAARIPPPQRIKTEAIIPQPQTPILLASATIKTDTQPIPARTNAG